MFGITQGRLTKSNKKKLQIFPKNIENEFALAKKIGFDYIEAHDGSDVKKNLIYTKEGVSYYNYLINKYNINIKNLLISFIIESPLTLPKNIKILLRLIKNIKLTKVKFLILPLMNKSRINFNNTKNVKKNIIILKSLSKILAKNNKKLVIESDCDFKQFFLLKKKIGKNLFFCFDVGNRAYIKRNIYSEIFNFKKYIKIIHIKDKSEDNENVKIGTGIVDFQRFFKILKRIRYKNDFTFETIREYPLYSSAKQNLLYFKNLCN